MTPDIMYVVLSNEDFIKRDQICFDIVNQM